MPASFLFLSEQNYVSKFLGREKTAGFSPKFSSTKRRKRAATAFDAKSFIAFPKPDRSGRGEL